jgi:hypothetical protein
MSVETYELRDSTGAIHILAKGVTLQTVNAMRLTALVDGQVRVIELNESCEVRQGESCWQALTKTFREEFAFTEGDITYTQQHRQQEEDVQRQKEADTAQEIERINELSERCRNGVWSAGDLQCLVVLLSKPNAAFGALQENDLSSKAHNDLIDEVIKNPNLTEPLKLMYAKAQLELQQQVANSQHEMQQQILNNLEQLSSNQAQSNSILKQNQKSGNQKAAIGMLGGMAALNQLGDISDTLGGDE